MKKKGNKKEQKPILLFILGLATLTLIGLFFQEVNPLRFSPGISASIMIPAYIISATILFASGILLTIHISRRKNA